MTPEIETAGAVTDPAETVREVVKVFVALRIASWAVLCTWSESASVAATPALAVAPPVTAPGVPEPGMACW